MEQLIQSLYYNRKLQVQRTRKAGYPLVFLDGKNICETELRNLGFTGIENFLFWVEITEKKTGIKIIQ